MEKAVDGFVNRDSYWDSHGGPGAIIIDLGTATSLSKVELYTYWDGDRYYQYNIELSNDSEEWFKVVDRSNNTENATEKGYTDKFKAQKGRYLKVNMLHGSANDSMHIVEVRAY